MVRLLLFGVGNRLRKRLVKNNFKQGRITVENYQIDRSYRASLCDIGIELIQVARKSYDVKTRNDFTAYQEKGWKGTLAKNAFKFWLRAKTRHHTKLHGLKSGGHTPRWAR